MHKREIGKSGLKFSCSLCGETFNFPSEVDKHQNPLLKKCPGRTTGGAQTAF